MNYSTGAPLSITSGITTITNTGAYPNVVGKVPDDFGKLTYVQNGVNYFPGYGQITDPGLAQISPACAASNTACNGMLAGYTNKAITDPSGNILFVNPQPGQVGNLGLSTLRGPSRFDL